MRKTYLSLRPCINCYSYIQSVDSGSIDLLTDEQVQDIDQFILRYTKLQDTMGTRLFTSILNYLYEPVDNRPMLDVLHRLEKLGLIDNIVMWQEVRLVRNRFAHDYLNDPEKKCSAIEYSFCIYPRFIQYVEYYKNLV